MWGQRKQDLLLVGEVQRVDLLVEGMVTEGGYRGERSLHQRVSFLVELAYL